MTFPLSDQPVLGEWFIFVELQGHVYNKSFEVQKYGKLVNLRILGFQIWEKPQMTQMTRGKMVGALFTKSSVEPGTMRRAGPLSCPLKKNCGKIYDFI